MIFDELRRLNDAAETEAEIEFVQRQLAAIDAADTDTTSQKSMLARLTERAAAHSIGVNVELLREHRPAMNSDGTYNGPALVQWFVDRQIQAARERWEANRDQDKSSEERQAESMAVKLEEHAKSLRRQYTTQLELDDECEKLVTSVEGRMGLMQSNMRLHFPEDRRETLATEFANQINQVLRRMNNQVAQIAERRQSTGL